MFQTKRLLPLLLAALMLTSCGGLKEADSTMDKISDDPAIVITELRTPTPTMPEGALVTRKPDPTPENPGPGNPVDPGNPDEYGDGAELEGYNQLLKLVDRSSVQGPGGWNRHVPGDLFDGIFETTDEGSNKFGTNQSSLDITWKMTDPVCISAYALYTANDSAEYPERNPVSWTLYGSRDGETWRAIHEVEDGGLPAENYFGKVFEFANGSSFRYYRWSLHSTGAEGMMQLSEILLYTKDQLPIAPQNDLPAFGAAETGKEATPLVGEEALDWLNAREDLTHLVDINSAVCTAGSFTGDEAVDRLFDGIYTAEEFAQAGGGKLCAPMTQAYIYWAMTEAVTPTGYVLITGNDTAEYPDRNPISWAFYGADAEGNWVLLDAVKQSNLQGEDFAPHVYTLDCEGEYLWFCVAVEQAQGSMQLCEWILCK